MLRGVISLFFHCWVFGVMVSAFSVPSPRSVSNHRDSSTRLQLDMGDSWQEISKQVDAAPSDSSLGGLTDVLGSGNSEPLILAGALVAVLALGFSVLASSSSKKEEPVVTATPEPEPEPIDVSIPYDAAILLAYKELTQEEPDVDCQLYAQFKKAYLEKAVAEVTLKQKARKLEQVLSTSP